MQTLSFLFTGWTLLSPAIAATVSDFKVQLFQGGEERPQLWALEITPPSGHHFNLEAPRSVQMEKLKFEKVRESQERILFQLEHRTLKEGSITEVSAFVCDEKKTYCMKKRMYVGLDPVRAKKITAPFSPKSEPKLIEFSGSSKTPETLFYENLPEKALADARRSGKPLLIDFYGIWCPPCNLYNETIFSTSEFKKVADRFVLLKMDADDELSWKWKSRFRIGGYPTLVFARLNPGGNDESLEELERIVGYFPPEEFYRRVDQIYLHRNDSQDERWRGRLETFLASALEQKRYEEVILKTEKSQEPSILIYRWTAAIKRDPQFLKSEEHLTKVRETLNGLIAASGKNSPDSLMRAVDLLSDEFWLKQETGLKMAHALIEELEKRLDPKTLFVKGSELTQADLDSMRMNLAEILKDETRLSQYRKKTIRDYESLIRHFTEKGSRDLRSMNLEYAYLLWKDGRTGEARQLYDQFMKKYPREFTFYYAASKMYQSLKDYPKARELAEKAYEFSYGDNRIRSLDRLLQVMADQGKKMEAFTRGKEFLKTFRIPEGLEVRTHRYLESLKKTIESLHSSQETPSGAKS